MKKISTTLLSIIAVTLLSVPTLTSCGDDDPTPNPPTPTPTPTPDPEPEPTPVVEACQGWPAAYGGVMLQAFYWDSFDDSQWTALEAQAENLKGTFDLVWLPQSGYCGGKSMGYDDLWWFNNYNSSFGNEQQLRSLIATLRQNDIKTIADVVINHRRNVSNWVDFPSETYKGVTYEMKSTDIVANDDGGATKNWATQNGYQLSANMDSGEGWDGMRDLDHKSENVQNIVKAYLDFLKNDLGYAGFRYDMVKGYSASYTGIYNSSALPEFSVGECWDGTATIKNWMEGTKLNDQIQSAAFDFQFRYTVRNAMNNANYSRLGQQNDGSWPLVSSYQDGGKYRRYAVTFVENHDTEKRSNAAQDPLKKDTLAANAYMLAMPGTPCVFLKHWLAYPSQIKAMVAARKAAGINNESSYQNLRSVANCYINTISTGNIDRLLVVIGNTSGNEAFIDAKKWVSVLSGYHYAYYLPRSMNIVYADLPSGTYEGTQTVTLSAVTTDEDAKIVYTTDGSNPTASSQSAESGFAVTIPVGTTTLKIGLLKGGSVSGIITCTFTVKEKESEKPIDVPAFCTVADGETCAFFEAPASWGNIKCWAWDDSNNNYTGGSWPGVDCSMIGTTAKGQKVWKWTYSGALTTRPTFIIFNEGQDKSQTADLPFTNGGYYTKDGMKAVVASK